MSEALAFQVLRGRPVLLSELRRGPCDGTLFVKVDRIITRTVVKFTARRRRPVIEIVSIDLVLFDYQRVRVLARLKDMEVQESMLWRLGERRCYWITGFTVRSGGERLHERFHLVFGPETVIWESWEPFPDRSFALRSADAAARLCDPNAQLVDVCGILKSYGKPTMEPWKGCYTKELMFVIEDRREKKQTIFLFHGDCVEAAFAKFESVDDGIGPVFVVVQYAIGDVDRNGHMVMASYYDATRVFVNPQFSEVEWARAAVIDALGF